MVSLNTIRTVTVRYQSEGADRMRADADSVAASQQRMGQAATQTATVTEQASRRQLSVTQALHKEMARIDTEFRQQQQLDRSTRIFDRAFDQGRIDVAERERLMGLAASRYAGNDNRMGVHGGLSSYDRSFVRYQAYDTALSLGSGMPLQTVAVQQGGQVLQQLADREGGLGAGLKQLAVSAAALVTPFTVATAAGTALGAAFLYAGYQASKEQELLERATLGLGRSTGATTATLDALARANAEAGKVSTSTARDMAAGYAASGQIVLPVFANLIQSTERYAKLTGQDTTAATQELARAFSDLTTGADAIAAKIGGLDDKTRQLIQTQIEQGDRSGAQATAGEYLKAIVEANTGATTGWALAWEKARVAADGYWEAAKKIAGIKLGVAPEGAQEAVDRLNKEVDNINERRKLWGQEPLGVGSSVIAERDAARLILDTQEREARARAAEERANQASRIAGTISRASEPNVARLSELRTQQGQLSEALADPLARSRLADFQQTETAYLGVTRAIATLVDENGRLVSSEELTRRGNQLQIDAVNAKTDAEKALVAQRQKAFDLIGKAIPGSDARSQIDMAGRLSLASSAGRGGGSGSDSRDEYDRAVRSVEDRMRRQEEESRTFGMGAEAVARYRTETELLTAAKRAEREITPSLTAQVEKYAAQAAEAAKRNEELREASRRTDEYRSVGSDGFRTLVRDLSEGATAGKLFTDVLGSLKSRVADLAATSLSDALFGRRGSSDFGLLGNLFSATGSGSGSGGGLLSSLLGSFQGWMPKFDTGGYTGPGGRFQPAGFVHAGEIVWSQDDIRRAGGVPVVEGMRRGYRGYADGGVVGGYSLEDVAAVTGAAKGNATGGDSYTDARVVHVDARGSSLSAEEVRAAVMAGMAETESRIGRNINGIVANGRRRFRAA